MSVSPSHSHVSWRSGSLPASAYVGFETNTCHQQDQQAVTGGSAVDLDRTRLDLVCSLRGWDRSSGGGHLSFVVVAVADHESSTVLVELVGERLDVGPQRCHQHLSSAVTDDLVEQRPTACLVGHLGVVNYLWAKVPLPEPARRRRP